MSEGNVPEPDSSVEMELVEDAVSYRNEPPTEAGSFGDKPMDVADDPIKEQPEKLDDLQDPKHTSPAKLVIKVKSPLKQDIKLTNPSKSPVKVASPIRGKRQSPSKTPPGVHSPSKKQSLDVTIDQTTMKVSSSGEFVAEKVTSPIKCKRESPSKPSEDVHSPRKKQSLEVIATDQTTIEVSSSTVAEKSDFSSLASKTSISEGEKNYEISQASPDPSNTSKVGTPGVSQASSDPSDSSNVSIAGVSQASSDPSDSSNVSIAGVSQASSDPSNPSNVSIAGVSRSSSDPSDSSNVSIAGVSQASSDPSDSSNVSIAGVSRSSLDPSDPSHVCVETCIHGGARPKTRDLTTVQRSSGQDESSRILEQMNRFAERMERSFSQNPECFGNVSQQDWTTTIGNTNAFAEELADEMGHGSFVHSSSNTEYPYYFPSILQLHRMFTGLSLESINVPETGPLQRMDTEQEPNHSQIGGFYQQEPTINIDQVPETTRPMDVDEVLLNSFAGWKAPEPEPVNQMDQEPPNEEVKAVEPQEEPQKPRQEYRLMRLAMRVPQRGPFIINPSHPYRHRDENMWRTAMMTAYRSERYHSKELLDDAMSQLEREGVSQEEFFRFYQSARRIDLFRDEGVEEEVRSEAETEEITIEDKINRIIIAVGFMTVAMLYMRLYIARRPEIESSSESSTMDSGNVDRSESEPRTDYTRLREHVNIDLGSSDNTDSPKGISSPDNPSPQEIQSPDFVPIPNRGNPVNVLVPLSQVPKRSDSPSSQGSLLVESDPSGSSSSRKGVTLRRAVLKKCQSQSLDNTSGDASPLPDEDEEKERNFRQFVNLCLQAVFFVLSEIKSWEEDRVESAEGKDKKDSVVDAETGEAPSGQDRCTEGVVDADKTAGDEDRSEADSVSQAQDSKNEGIEGGVEETGLAEEKMDQSEDVSMESTSGEKGEIECAERKEETDDASESDKVGDDSKTGDLSGSVSKTCRKRKENSTVEEERLAKRGKNTEIDFI